MDETQRQKKKKKKKIRATGMMKIFQSTYNSMGRSKKYLALVTSLCYS